MDYRILIYSLGIVIVILNLFVVIKISKYPYQKRKEKAFWTNIILIFPFFGILLFYAFGKKAFEREI